MARVDWPTRDPTSRPPDLFHAAYGYYWGSWEQKVYDIVQKQGSASSIYHNAAVAQAGANFLNLMSSKARGQQYSRVSARML